MRRATWVCAAAPPVPPISPHPLSLSLRTPPHPRRNTHRYGLAELLRAISEIPGIEWIRILYAYPSYFTDALIDEIASNKKVVKYIDIPLQHISGPVLLAMNRPHREHTEGLLRKLRERIPGLVLRTTFICGFPGEREEDHRTLVRTRGRTDKRTCVTDLRGKQARRCLPAAFPRGWFF